jgi:hypothetical protein
LHMRWKPHYQKSDGGILGYEESWVCLNILLLEQEEARDLCLTWVSGSLVWGPVIRR